MVTHVAHAYLTQVSQLTTQSCLNVFVNEFFIITHIYTQFYVYNGVSACQKSCLVVLTLLLICSDFMRDCFEIEAVIEH